MAARQFFNGKVNFEAAKTPHIYKAVRSQQVELPTAPDTQLFFIRTSSHASLAFAPLGFFGGRGCVNASGLPTTAGSTASETTTAVAFRGEA